MRALRRDCALSSGPKALLMNVSKKVARSPLWAGQGREREQQVERVVRAGGGVRCVCSDCVSVGVGE